MCYLHVSPFCFLNWLSFLGRKDGSGTVVEDLLSESDGNSGIWGHCSSGPSLKYFSGSRRKAGLFTSGSSFNVPVLNDLKLPSQQQVLREDGKKYNIFNSSERASTFPS